MRKRWEKRSSKEVGWPGTGTAASVCEVFMFAPQSFIQIPKPHLCLCVRESKFIFRAIPHQQFNLYQDMCAEGPSHLIQERSVPSATALMRGHAQQPWESARACITASHPSAGARERIMRILLTVPLVLIRHHAENGAKSLFCDCCFQMGANFRKFSGDSVPVYRWCSM